MDQQTIQAIVKASGAAPGEVILVHFWGENDAKPLADQFVAAVAACGASPVLLQQSRAVNQALFAAAEDAAFDERYFALFDRFDAVLDLFAQRPIVLGGQADPQTTERYRAYIRALFGKLMQCKRFAQIRLPTAANAEESGLPPEEYIRRMEAAYAIDYDRLRQDCAAAQAHAGQHTRAVLHTGAASSAGQGPACALHFDLTGRPWQMDAGDGDWPCGEVYAAPQEHFTHGSVYFEVLYVEDVGRFERVTLTVESGRAVRSDHPQVNAWLAGLATRDPANTVVCELGLGFNPGVTSLCGCTVLDEKMAGTFHIALGANQMFGGQNHAAVHIDLVGDGRLEFAD